MEAIITQAGQLVTAAVGWIGEYVTLITNSPVLLIGVLSSFVGLGVGLINRLMNVR